jgi:hypothetical protein
MTRVWNAGWKWAAVALLAASIAAEGQAKPDQGAQNPPGGGSVSGTPGQGDNAQAKPETHITPRQAKDLFRSVDTILHFASDDSKLPIKHEVKRRLTTRDAVEKYLTEKMKDDKDAKRMERSEIVLKKVGLLDRDFQLQPFLVSLLREQIAGYYDAKTKTVNLLDWIEPESQKPVLAHELTHALQDQHLDLDKWENQTDEDLSHNEKEDNQHLETDEVDSSREAVLEGQAMAVFVDWGLRPTGKTIVDAPDLVETLKNNMNDNSDSPVLARAPLLLQESLIFPYREGLGFEQTVLKDQGATGAFVGVLDRPPATSFEIMNPKAWEQQVKVPLLRMPDVHPLLDADWDPYDIGAMGALDVRIVTELFAGDKAAAVLTPEWNGGMYYAVQNKKLKAAGKGDSTASVALVYLSQWKSEAAAKTFASIYADELGKKYSGVKPDPNEQAADGEKIYTTSEGPALIFVSGKQVFTSESFDLTTARKLAFMMMGAQKGQANQVEARLGRAPAGPAASIPAQDLTGSLVRFLGSCGMMKVVLPR